MQNIGQNTGRVTLSRESNTTEQYNLFDEKCGNNAGFRQEALAGIWDGKDSRLSKVYFSQENIDALQQGIRYMVYVKTCSKSVIGNQSETDLKVVMRAIFLQNSKNMDNDVLQQVKDLNSMVIAFCVERIVNEIGIYSTYLNDISHNLNIMDRAQSTNTAGTKVLEMRKL